MRDFRALFIYPNTRRMSLVPPSISLLSQILKNHGFKVDLFDTTYYAIDSFYGDSDEMNLADLVVRPFDMTRYSNVRKNNVFEDLNRKVEEFKPDLIAVSSTESTFLLAIRLLASIQKYNILTILGGVFATFAPQWAISYSEIDIVCVGEGEQALPELCKRISRREDYSNIASLWVKQKDGRIARNPLGEPINIDANPLPDVGIFEENRHYRAMGGEIFRMFSNQMQRGCPFGCAFCNSPAQSRLFKNQTNLSYLRKRNMSNIHKELVCYRDDWKAEYIFFLDDTFLAFSHREIDEFCDMYSDIRLPFYCNAHPQTIDEYKIKRLKEAGLDRLGIGLEHGNEKFRRDVINRRYSNQDVIKASEILNMYDVKFSVNNIIGFPDETPELAMETVELNRRLYANDISCSIFQPYYGTQLRELAIERGYLYPQAIAPTNTDDSILEMPFFTREQIRGLRRTFIMYVRFPKNRWDEIKIAQQLTPAGDKMWTELRQEFIAEFLNSQDVPNPAGQLRQSQEKKT